MKLNVEQTKMNKPMCPVLLTKAEDCNISCSYRHILKATMTGSYVLPETGKAKFHLLEVKKYFLYIKPKSVHFNLTFSLTCVVKVLAPNHYALKLVAIKEENRKWEPVNISGDEWNEFNSRFTAYYTDRHGLEIQFPNEIGDMCVVFLEREPHRCRIFKKSIQNGTITVYLVDIGKTLECTQFDLYQMNHEFFDFPTQAIDVFLVDIQSSDPNIIWPSLATRSVEKWCDSMKFGLTNDFATAEIVKSFERTMLVKDFKLNRQLSKMRREQLDVGSELIKYQYAIRKEVGLHDIFNEKETDFAMEASTSKEVACPEKPMSEGTVKDNESSVNLIEFPNSEGSECMVSDLVEISDDQIIEIDDYEDDEIVLIDFPPPPPHEDVQQIISIDDLL